MSTDISLTGWDIGDADEKEWMPWTGSAGEARAKILASGDGYTIVFVDAKAGYRGAEHVHEYPEFNHVVQGTIRNQGTEMSAGDSYVAEPGSSHTDFEVLDDAKYVVIFKL
jgi:quercetin dioxygenase-like cupin family protein